MKWNTAIAYRTGSLATTLALTLATLAASVQALSISGTVKSKAGAALSGVSVTIKDSAKYATTTDANGNFSFQTVGLSSQGRKIQAFSTHLIERELTVQSPVDGALQLTLVDASGRSIWSADVVAHNNAASVSLPATLRSGAVFLRIRHAGGIAYNAVTIGSIGQQGAQYQAAARSSETFPTLVFKKSGFNDTTFVMTSNSAVGITVTMSVPTVCELPTTFKWKDYGKPIAEPKNGWLAIKDFTMVRHNGQYIVYMTYTPVGGGFKGAYMTPFADFTQAAAASQAIMPNNLPGVAPELIYFTPKNTWVYTTQWCSTGSFCYTTGNDPTKPTSFAAQTKPLLTENITPNAPIDQVVICDDANCYLFYADDKGNIYRGSMAKGSFPGNFTGTKKILSETNAAKLFEAVEVYKLKGQKKYLMIVECGYPRYFRAFTATDLAGTWTPVANTIDINTPFAGPKNVTNGWSNDISHGEIVRTGSDEYREIDPCNMQMIYQGLTSGGDYNSLPYKMGLLTLQR
ncbi:MAG: hypothetical protein RL318_537 [Fibrobacterota bacterium]